MVLIVKIPYSWRDQHIWQPKKNTISCLDIIGDVYFIDECKYILFRN